jgi:hypothetical protein
VVRESLYKKASHRPNLPSVLPCSSNTGTKSFSTTPYDQGRRNTARNWRCKRTRGISAPLNTAVGRRWRWRCRQARATGDSSGCDGTSRQDTHPSEDIDTASVSESNNDDDTYLHGRQSPNLASTSLGTLALFQSLYHPNKTRRVFADLQSIVGSLGKLIPLDVSRSLY